MNTFSKVLASVDFWKFAAPLIGAVIAWLTNEWRKRITDQYQRKETNYRELLKSVRGFYVGAQDAQALKLEFLNQLNMAWLYCPDDIIQKGYAFINTVHTDAAQNDETTEVALGAFVLAIRKDILSRKLVKCTSLKPSNFKHLKVN